MTCERRAHQELESGPMIRPRVLESRDRIARSPLPPGRGRSNRRTTSSSATGASWTAPAAPWFRADVGDPRRHDRRASRPASTSRRPASSTPPAPSSRPDSSTRTRTRAAGSAQTPTAPNYVRQGVTTVIEGPDGSSPVPLAPFLDELDALAEVRQHRQLHRPGLDPVRGDRQRRSRGDAGRDREDAGARRAGHARRRVRPEHRPVLRARHVHADERSHRAREGRRRASAASTRRTSATTPSKVLDSVRETIAIGEEGGLPTQVTHHKVIGKANWGRSVDALRLIDEARARGVDVTSDQYPYTASSTSIASALLPAWALEGGAAGAARAVQGSRHAREGARRHRRDDSRRARRRRSEERAVRELRLRSRRSTARRSPTPRRSRGLDADDRARRRDDAVDRRAGRLPGHLPRDERRRRRPHHAAPGDDDRVGRRGADVRARQSASAQLRHVRARARRLRAREARAHARGRGAPDDVVSGGAHRARRSRRPARRA